MIRRLSPSIQYYSSESNEGEEKRRAASQYHTAESSCEIYYEYIRGFSPPTSTSGSRAFSGMRPQNCIVNVIPPNVRGIRNGLGAAGIRPSTDHFVPIWTAMLRETAADERESLGTGPLRFWPPRILGSFISQEFDCGPESAVPHP